MAERHQRDKAQRMKPTLVFPILFDAAFQRLQVRQKISVGQNNAARLGVRLRFRARLRDFDAICQLVAADVGMAVVPEAAARRCARSIPITMIKIRDSWANRKLAICARSFKTLPRPAKQLVEHLRKAAQR